MPGKVDGGVGENGTVGLPDFGQAELQGRARGDAGLVGHALVRRGIPTVETGGRWGFGHALVRRGIPTVETGGRWGFGHALVRCRGDASDG